MMSSKVLRASWILAWACLGCAQAPPKNALAQRDLSAPLDEDVCFSPNGNCDVKLIQFVHSAKKSIDVAIYDINLEELKQELVSKPKTTPVRVIVDKRQSSEVHSLVRSLVKARILVRYGRQPGIFHNKFTIVDRKLLETGSFNYTRDATERNNENQVYLASPAIVEQYCEHFDELWTKAIPIPK